MHGDSVNHHLGQSLLMTGNPIPGRPTIGSWLTYGLGNESQDLPGFVVLKTGSSTQGSIGNWSSPHISPIVAKTRIGTNWRLESCRKDRKPRGCMGCGAYKASVGKPPAPGRPERGPGADAETHRGNAGGKPTISGQSRFSTPAAAHAGGPADCAARSHRGAGRGGRRKATATPCAW